MFANNETFNTNKLFKRTRYFTVSKRGLKLGKTGVLNNETFNLNIFNIFVNNAMSFIVRVERNYENCSWLCDLIACQLNFMQ